MLNEEQFEIAIHVHVMMYQVFVTLHVKLFLLTKKNQVT